MSSSSGRFVAVLVIGILVANTEWISNSGERVCPKLEPPKRESNFGKSNQPSSLHNSGKQVKQTRGGGREREFAEVQNQRGDEQKVVMGSANFSTCGQWNGGAEEDRRGDRHCIH